MLYLISGASRSGKTLLAEQLSAQTGLSYLSLDWLVMGFTNGMPESGIHDLLMPAEIAERAWPFFAAMIESMIWCGLDHIIEGEALLPDRIAALAKKHPGQLRVAFLGYTDIAVAQKVAEIKQFPRAEADWLVDKPEAYIVDHVENMIGHSKLIARSCADNGIRYFDTSEDFAGSVEEVKAYLLAGG